MATVIDPGAGALGSAFGDLLSAGANRINAKRLKQKQLESNPAQLMSLAPAARAAKSAGQLQSYADALGVDLAFADNLTNAFQPTYGEQVERARVDTGAASKGVAAENAQSDATVKTAGVAADASIAQNQALMRSVGPLTDAAISHAIAEKGTFDAQTLLNIPFLEASGQKANIETAIKENKYKGEYFDILNDNGQARVQANAERTKLKLGIQSDNLQSSAIDRYIGGINSIDQSTPEGRQMAFQANAYIANPGFASYLAGRESQSKEQNFRADLARQAANPTAQEAVKMSLDLQDKLAARLDDLMKAREGDNKDEIATAGQAYNNMASLVKDLSASGIIAPVDASKYDLKAKVLVPENFTSDFAKQAIGTVVEGLSSNDGKPSTASSIDEKIHSIDEAIAGLDELARMKKLSTIDKREILLGLQEIKSTLSKNKPNSSGVSGPKDALKMITGPFNFGRQMGDKIPAWFKSIQFDEDYSKSTEILRQSRSKKK